MKRILPGVILLSIYFSGYSQSFNTGETLKQGTISAGINPLMENNNKGIYFYGGYGLHKHVDIGFRYGIFKGANYFGADLEWSLRKTPSMNLSIAAGAHKSFDYGLDMNLAASFPLNQYFEIISGLDSDFNFNINNDFFLWLPFGLEIKMRKRISIIVEADIPLVEFTPGIIGGGAVFYLL